MLLGTQNADTINGNSGSDTLTGGLGNDTINGGGSTDTLVEQRDGDVTISNSTLTAAGGETDSLSGLDVISITGGGAAQTIDASGFTGPATISGEGGATSSPAEQRLTRSTADPVTTR